MRYAETKDYLLINDKMQNMFDYIEKESIEAIITDPPYELGFMGKSWDSSGVAFQVDTWQKCYDALKPGGYLLAFGGSRTYHRICCAIEDAGFEIRDCIMWLYGSGFPKSMDISKQIDRKGGNNYSRQFSIDLKEARESRRLTMKYCDDKYCNGSTNWSWYEGRKDGCRVPDYQTYLEIIKEFPELIKYKELIKEAEREVIGKKESGCFNNQEKNRYTIGSSKSLQLDITIPSTDLAKQWQGWGTCLKPAYEPIIVARKPFKGSLVDNVIENGVGGLNIGECRVGDEVIKGGTMPDFRDVGKKQKEISGIDKLSFGQIENAARKTLEDHNGRFPANVILTYDKTDFEEVCSDFPETKSQKRDSRYNKATEYTNTYTPVKSDYRDDNTYNDEGSAARYFYCAKASKKDRDEGLELFDNLKVNDGRQTPIDNPFKRGESLRKNIHPTVKPVELMQYLIRLVTPKGGTIMDCFMGSGSTGKAVMFENREREANYKFIGIEMTDEYLPICEARIDYALNKYKYDEEKELQEDKENGVLNIFDFM